MVRSFSRIILQIVYWLHSSSNCSGAILIPHNFLSIIFEDIVIQEELLIQDFAAFFFPH